MEIGCKVTAKVSSADSRDVHKFQRLFVGTTVRRATCKQKVDDRLDWKRKKAPVFEVHSGTFDNPCFCPWIRVLPAFWVFLPSFAAWVQVVSCGRCFFAGIRQWVTWDRIAKRRWRSQWSPTTVTRPLSSEASQVQMHSLQEQQASLLLGWCTETVVLIAAKVPASLVSEAFHRLINDKGNAVTQKTRKEKWSPSSTTMKIYTKTGDKGHCPDALL